MSNLLLHYKSSNRSPLIILLFILPFVLFGQSSYWAHEIDLPPGDRFNVPINVIALDSLILVTGMDAGNIIERKCRADGFLL